MQILLRDACLILSRILERSAICYLENWETQYGDSSTEVTELSFFFNFKKKKENMLTCKWPANKISENKRNRTDWTNPLGASYSVEFFELWNLYLFFSFCKKQKIM